MDDTTLDSVADFICGDTFNFPKRRSLRNINDFFESLDCNCDKLIDSSTLSRKKLTLFILKKSLEKFEIIIKKLASPKEYKGDKELISKALFELNKILELEELYIYIFKRH